MDALVPDRGTRAIQACLLPQLSGHDNWIKIDRFPPLHFIASVVQDAVVSAAERNDELVTDAAAERAQLRKPQMVGVGRTPSAEEARLGGYKLKMFSVAIAAWLAEGEGTFVDVP